MNILRALLLRALPSASLSFLAGPAFAVDEECVAGGCAVAVDVPAARLRAGLGALSFQVVSDAIPLGARPEPDLTRTFDGAPVVSLGVVLQQVLLGSQYPLLLQEHLSLLALRPVLGEDAGYALGGFADVLIGTSFPDLPVTAGLGPSFGLLHVEMEGDVPRPDLSAMAGLTALVGLEMGEARGIAIYAIGRLGLLLEPLSGEGSYATGEVAAAFAL